MNTKVCSICNVEKNLDGFHKTKDCKYGVKNQCKSCISLRNKQRYPDIREDQLKKKALQHKANPEIAAERYRRKSPESKQKGRDARKAWGERNLPHLVARNAARRALKLKATPPWLTEEDKQAIRDIYKLAATKTKDEGIVYHVDHIIPLKGEIIRGLHVPWNLQIIPAEENLSKGNKLE